MVEYASMKIRSSRFLALACTVVTLPVSADYIGSGQFYDVGKGTYSSNAGAQIVGTRTVNDSLYCWAGTGSNLMQYWQDTYLQYEDSPGATPNGFVEGGGFNNPDGTRYLNIYERVLEMSQKNGGGYPREFFDWWYKGSSEGMTPGLLEQPGTGYFEQMYKTASTSQVYEVEPNPLGVHQFLQDCFKTQGTAVGLSIYGNCQHAITCWGYETDQNGNISALILTDTDDRYFGAFRVDVEVKDILYWDYPFEDIPVLFTDDETGYYGNGYNFFMWVDAINTPDSYTNEAGETIDLRDAKQLKPAESTVQAGETMVQNVLLTEQKTVTGQGMTVGDGQRIVVLASDNGAGLSLSSGSQTPAGGTGLSVAQGSMVSLENLDIDGYDGGGLEVVGKTYLHDGQVSITNNHSDTDGGGASVSTYLEIKDCEKVVFKGNSSDGKGGAIYNKGNPAVEDSAVPSIVSIRGNGSVLFEGNSAQEGNDIYNARGGKVNIAENGSVRFNGSGGVAIVNKGELFLAADEGKSIDFINTSIDSTGGTVYIGRDINGRNESNTGVVHFNENALTIASRAPQIESRMYEGYFFVPTYPELELSSPLSTVFTNVTLAADAIIGHGQSPEESIVEFAAISTLAPLTMMNLSMDTTSTLTGEDGVPITLSNVEVYLTASDLASPESRVGTGGEDFEFNLYDMFAGNFSFNRVSFVTVDIPELTQDALVAFNLGNAYLSDMLITLNGQAVNGENVYFRSTPYVPEPSGGTLVVLSLAALAARRRRK